MRKLLLGVTLAAAAAAAQAGGQASLSCSGGYYGVPTLSITYTPGGDAGNPGLTWVGVLSPDQTVGAVLDITNSWTTYNGGLYPPNARFDGGIPGTVTVSVPFPGDAYGNTPTNTSAWVGYSIYMGHGIYTSDAATMVANRRTYLNSVKAERQAKGTWRAEYDDDTRFMWSLVQKNMVDKGKYGAVLTIPFLDCAPQDSGGGG